MDIMTLIRLYGYAESDQTMGMLTVIRVYG